MSLKRWKIIKSVVVSLSVLIFAAYAIMNGAEATVVAVPAVIMAGLLAGVEWSEFIAVWAEAYSIKQENDD